MRPQAVRGGGVEVGVTGPARVVEVQGRVLAGIDGLHRRDKVPAAILVPAGGDIDDVQLRLGGEQAGVKVVPGGGRGDLGSVRDAK